MTTLIIAEHDNTSLKAATLHTVSAALQCVGAVHVLVAGHHCGGVTEAVAAIDGVDLVLWADAPHFADGLAENVAAQAAAISASYSHILAGATPYGKNILPRLAALLDVAQLSDIVRIIDASTFERPIYAGNALATVRTSDAIKVATVRTTGFAAAPAHGGTAKVERVEPSADSGLTQFISREVVQSSRPELGSARIVVSGGRGLGSAENFNAVLEPLADRLGAALGASRAAVDAGFVPNDYQVGQTGKVVAPQLYIASGISGAIQHLAGMKDSKVIVAINKDPEAPIFSVADYGLVGDLFTLVPELVAELG